MCLALAGRSYVSAFGMNWQPAAPCGFARISLCLGEPRSNTTVSAMRCLATLYADPAYGQAKPGKKARAQRAAESAAVGTPWEDLLAFPMRDDDRAEPDGMNGDGQ
jgi:hypothetical protein